nr:cilia- and flagella-associated protein 206-like isoform X2 [Labrus bergylta]
MSSVGELAAAHVLGQHGSVALQLFDHPPIQVNVISVKSKAAVPTATVFPLFKALSKLWSGLQDEAELLNILNNISINLQPFIASQAKIFSEAHLDGLLESSEVSESIQVR